MVAKMGTRLAAVPSLVGVGFSHEAKSAKRGTADRTMGAKGEEAALQADKTHKKTTKRKKRKKHQKKNVMEEKKERTRDELDLEMGKLPVATAKSATKLGVAPKAVKSKDGFTPISLA